MDSIEKAWLLSTTGWGNEMLGDGSYWWIERGADAWASSIFLLLPS